MDWQVNDLAFCIAAHPLYPPEVQPGSLHTVEWIWETTDVANPAHEDIAFDFVGVARMPGDLAYWRGNFIRVTPEEPDEFDAQTIYELTYAPSPLFIEISDPADSCRRLVMSPDVAGGGSLFLQPPQNSRSDHSNSSRSASSLLSLHGHSTTAKVQ